MTRSEYNSKRTFAIRLFGIVSIALAVFVLVFVPTQTIMEKKRATAYVTGQVVSVDGTKLQIWYILPGEDEGWLVTKEGEGWEKGDEVRVFYDPDDTSVKYIEGFEDDPWGSVGVGIAGLAMGAGALIAARASRKSRAVNDLLDIVDR